MNKTKVIENIIMIGHWPYYLLHLVKKDNDERYTAPKEIVKYIDSFYNHIDLDLIRKQYLVSHVISNIGIHNLLIPDDDTIYLIGPFSDKSLSMEELTSLLLTNHLNLSGEIYNFYQSLPIINEKQLEAIVELLKSSGIPYHFQTIKENTSYDFTHPYLRPFFDETKQQDARKILLEEEYLLTQGLYTGDSVIGQKCLENYIAAVRKISYQFDESFIKEQLLISNAIYYRYTYEKINDIGKCDNIYYRFKHQISATDNNADYIAVHKQMFLSYLNLLESHSFDDYPFLIKSAIHYLMLNYRNPIHLSEVASYCKVSKEYLSHLFNIKLGISIPQYVTNIRLNDARILLKKTNLSVNEICDLCGFSDANYFIKQFKKSEGITPSQYRN